MLLVISPAKTLDYATPVGLRRASEPEFLAQANPLAALMRKRSPAQLSKLMGISGKLAELNHERFQSWSPNSTRANSRQALLAFMGDVYSGLDAKTLSARDIDFAQKHLRILSGLYGVLRPLDLIQPYRLEMGTRVENARGGNLYHYWGARPTEALNAQAASTRTQYLVNLASNEYFKVIDEKKLEPTVVTPVFKDFSNGQYKVLSFFAKKARGSMARYIIQKRLTKPDDLRDFAVEGYRFNDDLSRDYQYVFTRKSA